MILLFPNGFCWPERGMSLPSALLGLIRRFQGQHCSGDMSRNFMGPKRPQPSMLSKSLPTASRLAALTCSQCSFFFLALILPELNYILIHLPALDLSSRGGFKPLKVKDFTSLITVVAEHGGAPRCRRNPMCICWMDGWMDEWVSEWKNEWMNGQMTKEWAGYPWDWSSRGDAFYQTVNCPGFWDLQASHSANSGEL